MADWDDPLASFQQGTDLAGNITSLPSTDPASFEALSGLPTDPLALAPTPDQIVAQNIVQTQTNTNDALAATGVNATNLSTKAAEGSAAATATFGSSMAGMTQAGALTPSFNSLYTPYGTENSDLNPLSVSTVNGPVGLDSLPAASAFGSSGVLPPDVQQAQAASTQQSISAAQANQATIAAQAQNDTSYLVSLTDTEGFVLTFLVMPQIVENRSVGYDAVAPAQFPGAFQKYKGTESVTWNLTFTLISRTSDEATQNLIYINRLRGWTMPFYGQNTKNDPRNPFSTKLGAPPPVLMLSGFRKGIVGPTPVVIVQAAWDWPKDVDWIPAVDITATGVTNNGMSAAGISPKNIPFPTVINGTLNLVESFSTQQFNQFSLGDYRLGRMIGAYSTPVSQGSSTSATQAPPVQNAQQVQTSGPSIIGTPGQFSSNTPLLPTASYAAPSMSEGSFVGNTTLGNAPGSFMDLSATSPSLLSSSPFSSGDGGDFGGGGAGGSW